MVAYVGAELRDWNLSNPQDDVLAPSRSQTKPPCPPSKPLLRLPRVYTGFRNSLSSQREKLRCRLAGQGESDVGGEGLGLVGSFPKSDQSSCWCLRSPSAPFQVGLPPRSDGGRVLDAPSPCPF